MVSLRVKFKNAWRGLLLGVKDHSLQIQFCFMCAALILGFLFSFQIIEWCFLLLCIAFVISMEFINTVLERIMDFVHPEFHEKVRDIKDMAAGFVFLTSLFVLVVGVLLFGTKLF